MVTLSLYDKGHSDITLKDPAYLSYEQGGQTGSAEVKHLELERLESK